MFMAACENAFIGTWIMSGRWSLYFILYVQHNTQIRDSAFLIEIYSCTFSKTIIWGDAVCCSFAFICEGLKYWESYDIILPFSTSLNSVGPGYDWIQKKYFCLKYISFERKHFASYHYESSPRAWLILLVGFVHFL